MGLNQRLNDRGPAKTANLISILNGRPPRPPLVRGLLALLSSGHHPRISGTECICPSSEHRTYVAQQDALDPAERVSSASVTPVPEAARQKREIRRVDEAVRRQVLASRRRRYGIAEVGRISHSQSSPIVRSLVAADQLWTVSNQRVQANSFTNLAITSRIDL